MFSILTIEVAGELWRCRVGWLGGGGCRCVVVGLCDSNGGGWVGLVVEANFRV